MDLSYKFLKFIKIKINLTYTKMLHSFCKSDLTVYRMDREIEEEQIVPAY